MTSPADRCHAIESELEAFHLGQLSAEDATRVREHLRECPACAASLEAVKDLFRLADEIEEIEPSPAFAELVVESMNQEACPRSRPDRGAAAAVLALLALAGNRFRASRSFRFTAIAAGAHVVLLVVLELFFMPGIREEARSLNIRITDKGLGEALEELEPDGVTPFDDLPDAEVVENLPDLLPAPHEPDPAWPGYFAPGAPGRGAFRRKVPTGRRFPTYEVAALMMGRLDTAERDRRLREAGRGDDLRDRIAKALRWLVREQGADGSWSSGQGYAAYREGVTGLALLAFLADGHSVHRGDHREAVRRGVDWLASRQQRSGLLGDPGYERPMYGHAIATLALLEVYGLDYAEADIENRVELKRRIRAAVTYIVKGQKADGGWRYLPRHAKGAGERGDASVTIWQLMALELARDARFTVPEGVLARGRAFLAKLTADGTVRYQANEEAPVDATLTAGSLAIRHGGEKTTLGVRRALVGRALPDGNDTRNPLLWFYATLGLRKAGDGERDRQRYLAWTAYAMRTLLGSQRGDGSWSPDVRYGQQGGPVYTTALGALILAVDYRDARTL